MSMTLDLLSLSPYLGIFPTICMWFYKLITRTDVLNGCISWIRSAGLCVLFTYVSVPNFTLGSYSLFNICNLSDFNTAVNIYVPAQCLLQDISLIAMRQIFTLFNFNICNLSDFNRAVNIYAPAQCLLQNISLIAMCRILVLNWNQSDEYIHRCTDTQVHMWPLLSISK